MNSMDSMYFKNINFSKKFYILSIFKKKIQFFNDRRKFILKKYFYTINHKRIGLNYFYFSLITGISGALLATMIRLELAFPGSPFFKGDSLRYLQVMTAHALIMIFFVVVPIFFGGFANFLLPYHIGSKDVAFPRLNSLGFWIQPCGFLLIAKLGFLRPQFWKYYEKPSYFFSMNSTDKISKFDNNWSIINSILIKNNIKSSSLTWDSKNKLSIEFLKNYSNNFLFLNKNNYLGELITYYNYIPKRIWDWYVVNKYSNNFWYLSSKLSGIKRKKRYVPKCSSSTMTVSGWTFITPFSSKIKYTAVGAQDLLIVGVIFAGISTTISLTNLLVTRRTLCMPGLKNRRVLLPFISISILLMFRVLAVITPILGAAMIMLLLDRHWNTCFFDFTYGGDAILFQHLFWFFGHPEVYVLIIPAFGIINEILASTNTRRVASKHHMIWAIYIMTYMGFLVWGHHMYLIGLDHRSRSLYSTITIMISLPATIKVVNWTFTYINGALHVNAALLASISFFFFFMVAGFTGMWLSHVSLNITMHDTYYVVAHFHIMLSGATVMSIFAGFYYYFSVFFGIKYSRMLAYLHIIYYTGGQWLTFLPMFWLGFSGLPRRVHDYPSTFMGWQSMITSGHFISMIGVFFFYIMLLDSHYQKKVAYHNYMGIPRWNKRINYYIFKINYFQLKYKMFKNYSTKNIRIFIKSNLLIKCDSIYYIMKIINIFIKIRLYI